jgi:hypothetical protein
MRPENPKWRDVLRSSGPPRKRMCKWHLRFCLNAESVVFQSRAAHPEKRTRPAEPSTFSRVRSQSLATLRFEIQRFQRKDEGAYFFRITTGVVFFCGLPGVLRPSSTHF